MRIKWIMTFCLGLCALLALTGSASAKGFEPYWGYCNKDFVLPAKQHEDGDFANALRESHAVKVIGSQGNMLEVMAYTVSGEGKRAWLWKNDVSRAQDGDWRKALFVSNPDPNDRLNLRRKPDKDSVSLGKYYNGVSPVALGPSVKGWTKVRIDICEGYMQTRFLQEASSAGVPSDALRTLVITPKGGGRVKLKGNPWPEAVNFGEYASGETVKLLAVAGSWYHVEVMNGFTGYMPASVFYGQTE